MIQKFIITLHVPLGNRKGILTIENKNGIINGNLDIFGITHPFTGNCSKDGNIKLSGKITSAVCTFSYTAKGKITKDGINLAAVGERYKFTITGEEISKEEEI